MRYLIIGLGIYGSNLATDLTELGHEVIGADINASLVDAIKENISTAYIIDSTDEASLNVLPLKNVDIVIVAIGENFGASIKTVALLKKMGVKHIYARAIDELHQSILQGFNLDRILTPEQRAAKDLVNELELGNSVKTLYLDDNHYILKFQVPPYFYGLKFSDIDEAMLHGLRIVAYSRPTTTHNLIGIARQELNVIDNPEPDMRVTEGDHWTCIGSAKAYRDLLKHIS